MDVSLQSISAEQLAIELQGHNVLLVDVRPRALYCTCRIKKAESINFSTLHLRRLLKGVVKMETLIPTQTELCQKIFQRNTTGDTLVLYDASSSKDDVKNELKKHAEVLAKTSTNGVPPTVYFIDGGYSAFSSKFPEQCCTGEDCKSEAPPSSLRISVSASLPISFGNPKRAQSQLLTPIEGSDESSRFGPPVQVLPHVVLGCAKDAANITQLRSMGVTAILNVSHNCPNFFESLFEYKTIPVEDSYQADLLSKLQEAFDFINSIKEKQGCVFVHCHAGVSRSATVCIAYVMKHMQMDLTKSYDFVKQKRPCISPNLHFMGQLLEFEKQLTGKDKATTTPEKVEEMECTDSSSPTDNAVTTPLKTTVIDFSGSVESAHDSCNVSPHSASAPSFLDLYSSPKRKSSANGHPPVKYHINLGSTDGAVYHLTRQCLQQAGSISLPATPVTSLTNHLSPLHGLTFKSSVDCSLTMSPCRVAAVCGNNSGFTSLQMQLTDSLS